MPILKQIALVLVMTVLAGGAWLQTSPYAIGRDDPAGASPAAARGARAAPTPSDIVAADVIALRDGDTLTAIGTAAADKSVTLYAQTTGLVEEIAFRAGDRMEQGDVLLRLDDSEERIAVEQAKIALGTAEATVARYDQLTQSRAISAVQAEEARAALATARNDLAAAELALSRRLVRAPFDGVMGFAQVEIGDMLTATTPVADIDDRSTLLVEFAVPERLAGRLALDNPVAATTPAYPGETFEGSVEAVGSRVDVASRSLKARAALANADDRLRPGMSFSVSMRFPADSHPAVPKIAVQWDREGPYVWKVLDGTVRRTPVEIVSRTAEHVLVSGVLAVDDVVVAEGLEGLREGAEVVVAGTLADARPVR